MFIKRILLKNFRCYGEAEVRFSSPVTVICGSNGLGKTNILEAVYLNCGLPSFRTSRKEELVRFSETGFELSSLIETGGMERELRYFYSMGKSRWLRDGVKISPAETGFSCVLFDPEKLELVKGPGGVRRRFMDTCLCQLYPGYRGALKEYGSVAEKKAAALKIGGSMLSMLPEYTERMCALGAVISEKRRIFLNAVAPVSAKYHRDMSGDRETLEISYVTVPEGGSYEGLMRQAERLHDAELSSCRCLAGVHRDDIKVMISGREARAYASQGQARTAAVSMITASRAFMQDELGEAPVLLLDDVFSELDEARRGFLTAGSFGGQVIITSCAPVKDEDHIQVETLRR